MTDGQQDRIGEPSEPERVSPPGTDQPVGDAAVADAIPVTDAVPVADAMPAADAVPVADAEQVTDAIPVADVVPNPPEPVAPTVPIEVAAPDGPAAPRELAETVALAATPPEQPGQPHPADETQQIQQLQPTQPTQPADPSLLFRRPQPPQPPLGAPAAYPPPPPGATVPGTLLWQNGPVDPNNPGAYSVPIGPPEPVAPPEPPGPADGLRAAAAGLLNLSGLGLGYALMRRWRLAAVCWTLTAILLLIALPAAPGGVPGAVLVIYLMFLALAAAHGAQRGLRTPLAWPPSSGLAVGLAAVLLVVPIGGSVLFHSAQQEAVQRQLLSQLAQADQTVANAASGSLTDAEPQYINALATYADLLHNHPTSRAGKLVPSRLTAFYETVGAPFAKGDNCGAVAPLTFLQSVPRNSALVTADLGVLVTWPNDRLATSLYECGVSTLGMSGGGALEPTDLNELLTAFPNSPQARKVVPAVADAVKSVEAAGGSSGDPCIAVGGYTTLATQVSALSSGDASILADLKKDTDTLNNDVESGTFTCDVSEYKGGKFSQAQTDMDNFVTQYPNDPNKALAQKFSIAAQIAQQDADAGKVIPTLASGGSVSVTFMNDSPDPTVMLYTGPATGSVSLAACPKCTVYENSLLTPIGGAPTPCNDSSIDYPTVTITLPPGTTYFFQKSGGASTNSDVHTSQFDADTAYDECAYETRTLGLGTGL